MKGYVKVVGTNEGCTKLNGLSGEGELVYQNHHNYSLKLEGEDFTEITVNGIKIEIDD